MSDRKICDNHKTLVRLCQDKIFEVLRDNRFSGRLIKQLSKACPDHLMEPIFDLLLEQNIKITDVILVSYFTPNRTSIKINHAIHIRNSLFKLIGMNCTQLVSLFFFFNLHQIFSYNNIYIGLNFDYCYFLV